jgi:DNA-binding CsgD family transcriptional regulator
MHTENERASGGAGSVVSPTNGKREFVVIADAPPLAGAKAPFHLNQKERPRHRVMLELAAKGYDNKEIAANLGVSAVNVNNALRQPHSQQTLANLCRDRVSADEQVVQVIREKVVKAVETLAEIMEDEDSRNSDRIAAAEALLNRRYGKPNQPINSGSTVDLNHLSDEALAKMLPTQTETTTS